MKKRQAVLTLVVVFGFIQQYPLAHGAPSSEPCPPDSIQTEEICKCDLSKCRKPLCPYELQLTTNGSDTPGECCPTYTCVGCTNASLIEAQCPCAPGAILRANECTCLSPHHTLKNGTCTCDADKCPLPTLCDSHSVAVQKNDDCCPSTSCVKCPEDSRSTNNADQTIEDKCVCAPCAQSCAENEHPVIIHKGSGFPGSCCDIYKCDPKKCVTNGVQYEIGAKWTDEVGGACECKPNGLAICTAEKANEKKICLHEGRNYEPNEFWMPDACTNCTCSNGGVKCIAQFCELPSTKTKCPPLECAKECADGFKLNKRGCPICKCSTVVGKSVEIWQQYNLTRDELVEIIQQSRRNESICIGLDEEGYFWQNVGLVVAGVILALVVAFVVIYLTCKRHKKYSYGTCSALEVPLNHQEHPVQWHNNNNVKENGDILTFVGRKVGALFKIYHRDGDGGH